MQASNCSNYAASWRHPETDPGFLGPEYYQHIARVLEEGKFHMAFFDDRLAMPSRYADSTDDAVRYGIRTVKLEPCAVDNRYGSRDQSPGSGGYLFDNLLRPVSPGQTFRNAGPHDRRTGRMERRDLSQRL